MCGIIGYVGYREAWPQVLAGLQRLEYRGYDSTGVVTLDDGGLPHIHQSVGKVSDLLSSLDGKIPKGTLGLGHTRWATHGRPTLANSHPHTDCHSQVALVHNGIVENYLSLKNDLIVKGHIFTSDTDSEVLAHLIEEALDEGADFDQAFSQMATRISGANAVVAVWQGEPDKILGLRLGNAGGIAIAHKDDETKLASDLPALVSFSNEVVFLEDGEIVQATADAIRFTDSTGSPVLKKSQLIPQEWVTMGKEGYRHFMLKEIMDQPWAIGSTLRGRIDPENGRVFLENLPISDAEIKKLKRVVLVGCGTSFHAALVGRHIMERLSGLPTDAESSSEFRYRDPVVDETSLVIAIGQSGETADTLAAISEAIRKGARVITICNAEESQATRMSEGSLFMRSGLEVGVASTKNFMASISLLALLSMYISQVNGFLPAQTRQKYLDQLVCLPNQLGRILSDHKPYKTIARWLQRYDHVLYLGRGVNHPIALEGALKLKEVSYIHAEGYPAGEMKHGPIALIDESMLTIALSPKFSLYDKMISSIKEVKARDGKVLTIGTEGDGELHLISDHVLYIPDVDEMLIPFLTVVPLQLLAYYVAVQRGCDVDQPRNLAKSVTVE